MEVSAAEVASVLGVSQRRVRALIDAGRLPARKVAGRWLIDAAALPSPHRSRPMAAEQAWAILDDRPLARSRQAASRLRRQRARLADDPAPERLLVSWVASRARRMVFEARNPDGLLSDERLVASGVSDRRAGIAPGGRVEGYVREADLAAVRRGHLLRPGGPASNVVLHIVDELPSFPVPLLVLAADLAEHNGPRDLARARDLIAQAVS